MDLRFRSGPLGRGAPAEDEEDEKRRRRLFLLLLLLILFFGSLVLVHWLQERANARSDAASVILLTEPRSAALTYENMAPGDSVTRPVAVTNARPAPIRYGVASTSSERFLSSRLELTIKAGVALCTDDGFARSGTILYGPGPLGDPTSLPLFGSAGETDGSRLLAAGGRDVLCFRVELPLGAGSAFEQTKATASFCFAPADRLARELAEADRSSLPITC